MKAYSPFFNTFAARKFLKNIIADELPIKFYTHMKTCYFTVGINDDIRMNVYYHSGRPEMITIFNNHYVISLMEEKNNIVNDFTKAVYNFIIKTERKGCVEDQFVEYFSEWAEK